MRKFTVLLVVILCLWTQSWAQTSDGVYQGVIRVKLKPEANVKLLQTQATVRTKSVQASQGQTLKTGLSGIDALNKTYKAVTMRRVFSYGGEYEAKQEKYGLNLWYDIVVDSTENPIQMAKKYAADLNVDISEPVYKIRLVDSPVKEDISSKQTKAEVIFNDPKFGDQWHYKNTGQYGGTPGVDIKLPGAWNLSTGDPKVIVAVIDGGIDYKHEDLAANMWVNEAEANGVAGVDDDGNGYIDDIHGFNFVRDGDVEPSLHGTHVAGTVAAINNNGKGVSGVAGGNGVTGGVRLMSCQILSDIPGGKDKYGPEDAIRYAANNGAVIAQNSWGYEIQSIFPQAVKEAIDYFINNAGTDGHGNPRPGTPMVGGIVIFAASNDNSSGLWYPAAYDKVLSVASVTNKGVRAFYSNYATWVDISAPGGETRTQGGGVLSTLPNNQYGYMQGTSMACPHVSGVAALIVSKYGSSTYTPDKVWARLVNTTSTLSAYDPVNYQYMGSGLLNAEAALKAENTNPPADITNLSSSDITVNSALLTWTAPTDDDEVKLYRIALSTSPITAANFEAATIFVYQALKPAGQTESYTLTQLAPGTLYYAAIKSLDTWRNVSNISNINNFTTIPNLPPVARIADTTVTMLPLTKTTINLGNIFSDPENQVLRYTATYDQFNDIFTATLSGSSLTISSLQNKGIEPITVSAIDPFNEKATCTIYVEMNQNAPSELNKLLVYPVPMDTYINYSFLLDKPTEVELRVYSIDGRVVYHLPKKKYDVSIEDKIDTSTWPKGMYIIQYFVNGKSVDAKKLVK